MVVTSIDSEEAQERLAAIVATEAFVGVSRLFRILSFTSKLSYLNKASEFCINFGNSSIGSYFKVFFLTFRSFSQTVFEKLCVMFLSPLVSPMTKISLVGVFANMQADVEIIMKVFALGERIFNEAYNQQLILALIKSLTTLAVSCKFAVSELVII